jgi:hypothetical protein
MAGRTWVIAPDVQSLRDRWNRLVEEKDPTRKKVLFHPHLRGNQPGDKHLGKIVEKSLSGHKHPALAVKDDKTLGSAPIRYGYRSFDRQWLLPDARLINQPNPALWEGWSTAQVYLTALRAHPPSGGPALSITGLIPDLDHYRGSFGGRVYPLWRDATCTESNIPPSLLAEFSFAYGREVMPEEVVAYIAAVAAHPGYV